MPLLLASVPLPASSYMSFAQLYVRLRRVGHNRLVGTGGVFEGVVDAFLFHQPRGEVKSHSPVSEAVIPGLVFAPEFPAHLQAIEDLLQDVGHGNVLEDPALHVACQQPKTVEPSARASE